MSGDPQKTFYLETFGCQMNVHDSEKVVGTLVQEGYRQVETVEQADLILYNTCSIRDKAEQKVFHRLADYKKLQAQGKQFGVLGCVAQQEGEKIFERAPHVSLVCGSASYRKLPEMLVKLESLKHEAVHSRELASIGEASVAGLGRPTKTSLGASLVRITGSMTGKPTNASRRNSQPAQILIAGTSRLLRAATSFAHIAWCRSLAARSAVEHRILCCRKPGRWRTWGIPRFSCSAKLNSYVDPSRKKTFAESLAAVAEVQGIRRVRFTTSHPRDFGRDIVEAIDAVPTLCDHVHLPVQSGSTRILDAMSRLYDREQYLERILWMKSAKRQLSITTDVLWDSQEKRNRTFRKR